MGAVHIAPAVWSGRGLIRASRLYCANSSPYNSRAMRSEVRPRPTEPPSSSRPELAVGSRAAGRRGSYALLVVSLLASFGVAEVGLRLLRYRPWGHGANRTEEPALHEPDSILGWV